MRQARDYVSTTSNIWQDFKFSNNNTLVSCAYHRLLVYTCLRHALVVRCQSVTKQLLISSSSLGILAPLQCLFSVIYDHDQLTVNMFE